jgi:hypothetical protein
VNSARKIYLEFFPKTDDKGIGPVMSIFALLGRLTRRNQPVRTGRLRCPSCKGDELAIRQQTGIEGLISSLTNTRKYKCFRCRTEFRAPDRRKTPRAESSESTALRRPV